jgi:F-type H+-transporting ATPase subunit delta
MIQQLKKSLYVMNQSLISIRYAKALYLKASEKQVLPDVLQDIQMIDQVLSANSELDQTIRHPVLNVSKKQKILNTLFENRVHPITLRFIDLIIKNRRAVYIHHISRNFIDLHHKNKGIKKVSLTTALPVGASEKDSINKLIMKYFHAKQIEFTEHIDAEILGGFIIQIEDQLLDASVKRQLEKVRHHLIHDN